MDVLDGFIPLQVVLSIGTQMITLVVSVAKMMFLADLVQGGSVPDGPRRL